MDKYHLFETGGKLKPNKNYIVKRIRGVWGWTSVQSTTSSGKSNVKSAKQENQRAQNGRKSIALDTGMGLMAFKLELYNISIHQPSYRWKFKIVPSNATGFFIDGATQRWRVRTRPAWIRIKCSLHCSITWLYTKLKKPSRCSTNEATLAFRCHHQGNFDLIRNKLWHEFFGICVSVWLRVMVLVRIKITWYCFYLDSLAIVVVQQVLPKKGERFMRWCCAHLYLQRP